MMKDFMVYMAPDKDAGDIFIEDDAVRIALETEEGKEEEFEVIGIFDIEGKEDTEYIAITPVDENSEEVYILRYKPLNDDEFEVEAIEDDEEFERAAREFDEIMDAPGVDIVEE